MENDGKTESEGSRIILIGGIIGAIGVLAYLFLVLIAADDSARPGRLSLSFIYPTLAAPFAPIFALLLVWSTTGAARKSRGGRYIGIVVMGLATAEALLSLYYEFDYKNALAQFGFFLIPVTAPFGLGFVALIVAEVRDRLPGRRGDVVAMMFLSGIIALGALAWSASERPVAPDATQTHIDSAHFYSLILNLTYEGSPTRIKIVGGCDGVYMTAFAFGVRIPGGHAIVIRSIPRTFEFQPCRNATTSNGQVPTDWLPLIVWYERDDDFSFGMGYATREAYASARAKFGFISATVEAANRADFEAFRKDGTKNALPFYLADVVYSSEVPRLPVPIPADLLENPRKAWRYAGEITCRGAWVVPLREQQKAWVRSHRPAVHGTYWVSRSFPEGPEWPKSQRRPATDLFSPPAADIPPTEQGAVYPISISDGLASVKDRAGSDGPRDHVLHVDDPTLRGFEYCEMKAQQNLMDAEAGRSVGQTPARCRIGDDVLPLDGIDCVQKTPRRVFKDTQYSIEIYDQQL